jgi:hypothetical protein
MEVTIVGPPAWQPALEAALAEVPAAPPGLVRAIVEDLHGRHVGIAALPAARLAAVLARRHRPVASGADSDGGADAPWGAVLDRLEAVLAPAPADGGPAGAANGSRPRARVRLAGVPFFTVARLVAPLVAEACARERRCYLFGGRGHPVPGGFAAAYAAYQARQIEAVARLAAEQQPAPLFWSAQALAAAGLSRPGAGPGLPWLDAATLALMLRLEPDFGDGGDRRASRMPRLARPSLRRQGTRPKEGGVTGIRVTWRPDDVADMIQTEHLNPSLLLLDRLVNTGFLARHRPPPRQRRRDVLVLGLSPAPGPGEALAVAKACWFDLLVRLAAILQSAGLDRSDFLWLEADPVGGVRACDLTLEGLAPLPAETATALPAARRVQVLGELGLVPRFVDRRARYPERPGPPPAAADAADATGRRRGWADWAGAALHEALGRRRPAPDGAAPATAPDEYGAVLAFACLPAEAVPGAGTDGDPDPDPVADRARLGDRLGLSGARGQGLTLVELPARPAPGAAWRVAPPGRPWQALAGTDDLNRLAGGLVGAWLETAAEVIFGE